MKTFILMLALMGSAQAQTLNRGELIALMSIAVADLSPGYCETVVTPGDRKLMAQFLIENLPPLENDLVNEVSRVAGEIWSSFDLDQINSQCIASQNVLDYIRNQRN